MTATYTPLHEVCDRAKFAALVESFRLGRPVPPVVVQGETALSGSHRVAAHAAAWRAWDRREAGWEDSLEPTLDTVEVSEEDYAAACGLLGIAWHRDVEHFDLFAAALHAATEDEALKAALADQRGDYGDYAADDFARYAEAH